MKHSSRMKMFSGKRYWGGVAIDTDNCVYVDVSIPRDRPAVLCIMRYTGNDYVGARMDTAHRDVNDAEEAAIWWAIAEFQNARVVYCDNQEAVRRACLQWAGPPVVQWRKRTNNPAHKYAADRAPGLRYKLTRRV